MSSPITCTHTQTRKGGNFLFELREKSLKRELGDDTSLESLKNVTQGGMLLSLQRRGVHAG